MASIGPPGVGPVRARSFDPNRVGGRECRAWAAYYRKEWVTLLVVSVGLVHAGFRMSWPRTLRGAWLVLRANQLWAPYPDNDPDGPAAAWSGSTGWSPTTPVSIWMR